MAKTFTVEDRIQHISPTPWHNDGDGLITDANEASVAEVVRLADAPLIAAAPEMAEALRPFVTFLRKFEAKPIQGLDKDQIYAIHGGDGHAPLSRGGQHSTNER